MIYQSAELEKIPGDCMNCPFTLFDHCRISGHNVFEDTVLETRSADCPLRSGSVMEWVDVRDRLPDFTGPVLVSVWERAWNNDMRPVVKPATFKTKYKQFFRVQGTVIAWMPYPDVYRR